LGEWSVRYQPQLCKAFESRVIDCVETTRPSF
jgi:hypothetical protein